MSDCDYDKIFKQGRLHPWIADHKQKIDAYLSFYKNTDIGEEMAEFYRKKEEEWLKGKAKVPSPQQELAERKEQREKDRALLGTEKVPVEAWEEGKEENKDVPATPPKKRGRPKKSSPSGPEALPPQA